MSATALMTVPARPTRAVASARSATATILQEHYTPDSFKTIANIHGREKEDTITGLIDQGNIYGKPGST